MKKVLFILPFAFTLVLATDAKKVQDCVEAFQQEIADIIYQKQENQAPSLDDITKKVNHVLETECDLNVSDTTQTTNANDTKVLILDTSKGNNDCIENFSKEIQEILYEKESNPKNARKVRVIIKGDGNDCTSKNK